MYLLKLQYCNKYYAMLSPTDFIIKEIFVLLSYSAWETKIKRLKI